VAGVSSSSQRRNDGGTPAPRGGPPTSYSPLQRAEPHDWAECVRHEGPWRGVDDLELATLNWVWWFNHVRIHGEIGYVTPVEFETAHSRQINPQEQPLSGKPSLH
jgi:putative transposase